MMISESLDENHLAQPNEMKTKLNQEYAMKGLFSITHINNGIEVT